ncbi:nuclear transport factor 2 family protein [Rhizobium leguminosarum]|nr:nuclear transport factor 2 family protein [Rhizobium leguminosarum]NZD53269.1 nuclear transport factor 2 family protein [Rhizobium leguminosarum]
MSATTLRAKADALITATNAFDTEAAVTLFTPDAVIDDPSTGHSFDGHAGIRDYDLRGKLTEFCQLLLAEFRRGWGRIPTRCSTILGRVKIEIDELRAHAPLFKETLMKEGCLFVILNRYGPVIEASLRSTTVTE